MGDQQWGDGNVRCFGMLLDGRARETGIPRRGEMATLLIVFNSWQDVVGFKLPDANGSGTWELVMDTNLPDHPEGKTFKVGDTYQVTGRSMLVLQLA